MELIDRFRALGIERHMLPDNLNEFFGLFLDRSMTYSCAVFSRGATTLEEAQEAKLELLKKQRDELVNVVRRHGATP